MLTDYKFWYHTVGDDGNFTECAVRFYFGEVTTKNEYSESVKGDAPVTRYRRSEKIDPNTMNHTKNKRMKKDSGGLDCVVYTTEDFGIITKESDLIKFINKEMAKDKRGNNIPQQR